MIVRHCRFGAARITSEEESSDSFQHEQRYVKEVRCGALRRNPIMSSSVSKLSSKASSSTVVYRERVCNPSFSKNCSIEMLLTLGHASRIERSELVGIVLSSSLSNVMRLTPLPKSREYVDQNLSGRGGHRWSCRSNSALLSAAVCATSSPAHDDATSRLERTSRNGRKRTMYTTISCGISERGIS